MIEIMLYALIKPIFCIAYCVKMHLHVLNNAPFHEN
jgi:hypothetical protein